MGAHSYCPICDAPQIKSTILQVIDGEHWCRHCNSNIPPNRSKDECIIEMSDEIERLLDLVKALDSRLCYLENK